MLKQQPSTIFFLKKIFLKQKRQINKQIFFFEQINKQTNKQTNRQSVLPYPQT
jgi:hypothetical protein